MIIRYKGLDKLNCDESKKKVLNEINDRIVKRELVNPSSYVRGHKGAQFINFYQIWGNYCIYDVHIKQKSILIDIINN